MIINIIDQRQSPQKPPLIYCKTKGCYNPTRGGKNHCSQHVLQNEYAQKILAHLKRNKRTPQHELK